ncbi:MAG TPA: glycoside hydrolase family 16 protein [Polyangiaceae bacterium]|nr:glycoside hydrolase family 16 protein [Polyangiaceae bacterium]
MQQFIERRSAWSAAACRGAGAALAFAVALGTESTAQAVTGAELGRNAPGRHGRFEARLMFAPGDGIVSSMFLWKPGSELEDTYWNEIDIEKVGTDCGGYSSNAIYGNPEMQSTERVTTEVDLCAGYHTHSIEWTPDHLIWRLDGTEVRRLDADELAAFEENAPAGMQIRFNLWVGDASFGGSFQSASLPAYQYIDWVAYSSYTPGTGGDGGDFTPLWREDFDAPLGSDWSFGTWASPLGHSVHSPANVTVTGGIGVLSLTDDGATGYSGTPPPGEPTGGGAQGGSSGTAGVGAGGPSGGAAGDGVSAGASSGGAGAGAVDPAGRERSDSGCQLGLPHARARSASGAGGVALVVLLGGLDQRRRRRARH